MPIPFSGGCACRAVRYEGAAEPLLSLTCHCRDCQRATGSGYSAAFYVSQAALRVTGEVRYYDVRSEGGQTIRRGFCPQCGSRILAKASGWPEFTAVIAASLDDPSWFRPAVDIWTASSQPWDALNPHLPRYERQPIYVSRLAWQCIQQRRQVNQTASDNTYRPDHL